MKIEEIDRRLKNVDKKLIWPRLCKMYVSHKAVIKCLKCGYVYTTVIYHAYEHACPNCNKYHSRFSVEKVDTVLLRHGYKRINHSKYRKIHTPMYLKCIHCGTKYYMSLATVKREKSLMCPMCKRLKNGTAPSQLIHDVEKYFIIIKAPKAMDIKESSMLRVKCKACHTIFNTVVSRAMHGCCSTCALAKAHNRYKKSPRVFRKQVRNIGHGHYIPLLDKTPYINDNTSILMLHTVCHKIFRIKPTNFLDLGDRCPYCRPSSYGEVCVMNYLENKCHIHHYIHGYRLPLNKDSRNNLHIDVFIPTLRIGIEFDGIQHFKPVRFSYSISQEQAKKNLKSCHYRDQNKNLYCSLLGIKLIRIEDTHISRGHRKRKINHLVNHVLDKKLLPLLK